MWDESVVCGMSQLCVGRVSGVWDESVMCGMSQWCVG